MFDFYKALYKDEVENANWWGAWAKCRDSTNTGSI